MPAPPRICVLIPTYNRSALLLRALDSVAAQTCEAEVVVSDDGSTDDTPHAVRRWSERTARPVRYVRHENAGQHVACNRGVAIATAELVTMLDSDDLLVPDAIERYLRHWDAIPAAERAGFCGVVGNGAWYRSGEIQGTHFPKPVMDATLHDIRFRWRVRGDKFGAYRRDLLAAHPYPVFPGERRFRMSWVAETLALDHRSRFVDEIFHLVDQQPGGLSSDTLRKRLMAPRGLAYCFRDEANRFTRGQPVRHRHRAHHRYVRFALDSGLPLAQMWREIDDKILLLLALPIGVFKWLRDRASLRSGRVKLPAGAPAPAERTP